MPLRHHAGAINRARATERRQILLNLTGFVAHAGGRNRYVEAIAVELRSRAVSVEARLQIGVTHAELLAAEVLLARNHGGNRAHVLTALVAARVAIVLTGAVVIAVA